MEGYIVYCSQWLYKLLAIVYFTKNSFVVLPMKEKDTENRVYFGEKGLNSCLSGIGGLATTVPCVDIEITVKTLDF